MAQDFKFLVDYHLLTSNNFLFQGLAQWSADRADIAFQELGQLDKNETTTSNLQHCGNAVFSALTSRVAAVCLLFLEAVDVATAKVLVRPFRAVTIFFDSGITLESVKRAVTAAGLSLAIGASKIAVATASVIAPELTLGYLQLEKQLAKMHFWWVALRLSSTDLTWFAERNNTIPASELRGHFVNECMNRYRNFNGKHFGPLYEAVLRPTRLELSNHVRSYRDLITEFLRQTNAGVGATQFYAPSQDISLERSPFSIKLAQTIEVCGNYFIDQQFYVKEEIESFMGSDYVAVLNNSILNATLELFQVEAQVLQLKQTGLQVESDDIGKDVFDHKGLFTTVLQKHQQLSVTSQEALKWHLCCDEGKMQGRLIPQESPDFEKIRDIVADITKIRIELVEQRIAARATSVLQGAFDKLHTLPE